MTTKKVQIKAYVEPGVKADVKALANQAHVSESRMLSYILSDYVGSHTVYTGGDPNDPSNYGVTLDMYADSHFNGVNAKKFDL